MTRFLLVRHAAHDWLGRGLAGRLPGVSLNADGRAQAEALVARLEGTRIDGIWASPQPRTQQTAGPLAQARGLPVGIAPEFDEVDFGAWTGAQFADLPRAHPEAWQQWCERRGSARPPGGEAFADVPRRALAGLRRLRDAHGEGAAVLVVSHGDVLRGLVAACLGLSLDHLERIEIAPASLSVLDASAHGTVLRLLNATA